MTVVFVAKIVVIFPLNPFSLFLSLRTNKSCASYARSMTLVMMSRLSARYLFGIFYSVDRDQARVSQSPLILLFSLPEHLRLIYSFRFRCVNVVEANASSRPTASMTRKKKKGVRLKKNLGVDALFTFFDDRWSLVSLRMSQ